MGSESSELAEVARSAIWKAHQCIRDSGESLELCNRMCNTLNALIECDFSTGKVLQLGLVGKGTLYRHMSHESFEAALEALDSFIVNKSLTSILEIGGQADTDSTRLKANQWILEGYRPDKFDAGVRRQRIANSATDWLSQLLNNRTVPIEVVDDSLQNDPFKELPEPTVIPDNSRPLTPDK